MIAVGIFLNRNQFLSVVFINSDLWRRPNSRFCVQLIHCFSHCGHNIGFAGLLASFVISTWMGVGTNPNSSRWSCAVDIYVWSSVLIEQRGLVQMADAGQLQASLPSSRREEPFLAFIVTLNQTRTLVLDHGPVSHLCCNDLHNVTCQWDADSQVSLQLLPVLLNSAKLETPGCLFLEHNHLTS